MQIRIESPLLGLVEWTLPEDLTYGIIGLDDRRRNLAIEWLRNQLESFFTSLIASGQNDKTAEYFQKTLVDLLDKMKELVET